MQDMTNLESHLSHGVDGQLKKFTKSRDFERKNFLALGLKPPTLLALFLLIPTH